MTSARLIFELANAPSFVRLKSPDGLAALPPGVEAVSAEGLPVKDEDVLTMPMSASLRCLDLDSTLVTDLSLSQLADMPGLEELWLECTGVTDAGIRQLAGSRSLRFLSVAHTEVTAAGVQALMTKNPQVQVSR